MTWDGKVIQDDLVTGSSPDTWLWDAAMNFQKEGRSSQALILSQTYFLLFKILPEDELFASKDLQTWWYGRDILTLVFTHQSFC